MDQGSGVGVTFQRENLGWTWYEMLPLFQRHWAEVSHYADIPLNPDRQRYVESESAGIARLYTARGANRELIGYAIFFVNYSAHYRSSLQAVEDVIFVAPEHRRSRVGSQLISYCDDQLREDGVQVVYHHVKTKHNFGPLLERLGYEHVEQGYWKRLDRPQGAAS